jgi:hypothetical protein
MTERQTSLDLNGPILSFITQPVGLTTSSSTATFVGIATATFPTQTPANPATNTGTIEYRWYAEGSALTDGSFRGATISGTATTTLTLSSLKSPETNNVNFFLRADYTPSAYGLPGVAITEGTARFTGNAVNDPLDSNVATLTVLPTITITSQPGIATVGAGSRASFVVAATITDSGFGELSYQWNIDGQNLTDNGDTIIGATQPTLFFVPTGSAGVSTVKVTVSNPNAISVVSNVVNLNILSPRNIIIFEGFDSQNNYKKIEVNLDTNDVFLLTDDTFGSNFNIINFYAAENNIDAELEIRTSKGLDTGSYFGGQGGISRIRITLEKNIEYIVLGISNNSGLFIYRGSTLIAAVGKGGDAGSLGNGGAGGGVNDSGGSGSGRNSGSGGVRPSAGELTTNGIFGSNSTITTFLPGDSKATIPNGGRTISCPKGSYWVDARGVPPCSNIGFSQFYNANQTLIPQSSLINRGFKPGYTITSTEGARISNGGTGGTGATGGSGGDGGGGGGGSGYTNNSYTVLSSSFGGNNSLKSTINFKVFVPPAPAPPAPAPPAPAPAPAPPAPPAPAPAPAPTISSFTAQYDSIPPLSGAVLSWSSTGGTSATIDQGVGPVSASGVIAKSFTETTTFTLTVTNSAGASVTASTTVTVVPNPTITSFTASPSTIASGGSTTLSWASIGAVSGSISNFGLVAASGSVVASNITRSTIFSLVVSNSVAGSHPQFPGTSAFAQVAVTVI